MLDVAIVGGGISGLAAAYELQRQGLNVRVLEAIPRAGGVITTERFDDWIIDGGPDSILVQKPAAVALCRELGIADRLISTLTPSLYNELRFQLAREDRPRPYDGPLINGQNRPFPDTAFDFERGYRAIGVLDTLRYTAEFLASGRPLHVLINNAGVVNLQRTLTPDGLEAFHIGRLAIALFGERWKIDPDRTADIEPHDRGGNRRRRSHGQPWQRGNAIDIDQRHCRRRADAQGATGKGHVATCRLVHQVFPTGLIAERRIPRKRGPPPSHPDRSAR